MTEFLPALVAGLAATIVMSAMMTAAAKMGLTKMPPMHLILGSMMTADSDQARRLGMMLHYIVMGTVVFGLAYAALFTAFDSASAVTGIVIGAVHGLILGGVAMPMMPAMHPRMSAAPGDVPVLTEHMGEVALTTPGFFGIRWGGMTPVGILVGHVVYGLVVALIYDAFV
jgi:uncharacterized membrane protein YagU involved in acid resistance